MDWDQQTLIKARDEHEDWLMRQAGVQGSSIGYDDRGALSIKILTDSVGAAQREEIRQRLGDLPVFFQETGPIAAQAAIADATAAGAQVVAFADAAATDVQVIELDDAAPDVQVVEIEASPSDEEE